MIVIPDDRLWTYEEVDAFHAQVSAWTFDDVDKFYNGLNPNKNNFVFDNFMRFHKRYKGYVAKILKATPLDKLVGMGLDLPATE